MSRVSISVVAARCLETIPAIMLLSLLTACGFTPVARDAEVVGRPTPDPAAPRLEPVSTRLYSGVGADQEVLGELQVVFSRHENTLVDFARRYDVGLDELRHANPNVDVWLPGEETPVYLPTMTILPEAPREGLVLNLPTMRLFYFVPGPEAEGVPRWSITSHPVGIGREGWATPTGQATITGKVREPTWYPPASVRAEHAELGDPLPAVVPPGPDNPLGRFALVLSLPGYLIHGTNKPPGVGMRVSHGCVRLYPEDIEGLFERIEIGTPVHIVNQPILAGWRDGQLFLEAHPPLSEDDRELAIEAHQVIEAALLRGGRAEARIDEAAVAWILAEQSGMPLPILKGGTTPLRYLAAARVVENDLPVASQPAEQTPVGR